MSDSNSAEYWMERLRSVQIDRDSLREALAEKDAEIHQLRESLREQIQWNDEQAKEIEATKRDGCGHNWDRREFSGCPVCAMMAGVQERISTLERQIVAANEMRRSDLLKAPSQLCREYKLQNCHFCDRTDCCDNASEAKKQIAQLRQRNAEQAREITSLRCCVNEQQVTIDGLIANNVSLRARVETLGKTLADLTYTASRLWDIVKPIKDSGAIRVTHPIIEKARMVLNPQETQQ